MAYRPPTIVKCKKKHQVHHLNFNFRDEHAFDTFVSTIHNLARKHPTDAYLQGLSDLIDKADKEAD